MAQMEVVAHPIRIGPQGRIVIPAAPRRALGWHPGDELIAWVEDDRLILRPRASVEQELWDLCAPAVHGLADELIAERRAEAAREA
jgi:AbrB family looped-hinge helix DNA binding protein